MSIIIYKTNILLHGQTARSREKNTSPCLQQHISYTSNLKLAIVNHFQRESMYCWMTHNIEDLIRTTNKADPATNTTCDVRPLKTSRQR